MKYFLPTLFGATTIALVQPHLTLAQTAIQPDVQAIKAKAQQITVKVNPYGDWGSGAIIGRNGNTYYVLTATHVIDGINEGEELLLVTHDDEYHKVDKIESLPNNLDLTLLQFTNETNKEYTPVAISRYNYPLYERRDYENNTISDASTQEQYVFVSGWPLGRKSWEICQTNEPPKQCQQPIFNPGFLFDNSATAISQPGTSNPENNYGGYDLIYTNLTHPGLSGGAVLDTQGRLVGIHGRADGRIVDEDGKVLSVYLDEEEIKEIEGDIFRVKVGLSLGIPSQTFLNWASDKPVNNYLAIEDSAPASLEQSGIESVRPPLSIKDTNDPYHWIEKGNQLWRISNFPDAHDSFDKAIELREDLYLAWFAKGFTLGFDRQYEKALAACDRAIELNAFPNEVKYESHRCKAGALQQLQRPEEALTALNEAIDINDDSNPDNPADLMLQGELNFALGEYKQALESLNNAVNLRATQNLAPSALLHNNRALVALELEQYKLALKDVETAIAIDGNFAPAWRNKGLILETTDRNQESLAAYDKALELDPQDYNTWTNKGFTLYKLQRYQEAKQSFEKALEINSNYQPAIENLKAVESLI